MSGDYKAYQSLYSAFQANIIIPSTEQTTTIVETVKSANHQIFLQKVTLQVNTHAAGKVFTVQTSNASPVVIIHRADLAAAAGVPDQIVYDFGPAGTPVTLGESLNYLANTGGSGFVGRAHFEGYQKLIGPVTVAQAASGG